MSASEYKTKKNMDDLLFTDAMAIFEEYQRAKLNGKLQQQRTLEREYPDLMNPDYIQMLRNVFAMKERFMALNPDIDDVAGTDNEHATETIH